MPSTSGNKKTDVLTPLQRQLLGVLFSDLWFRRHFYLTGGTALAAFYLYHRFSEDLDFFSHGVELQLVPRLMEEAAKKLGQPLHRVQTTPGFMRFQIGGELKIDVVGDVGFRVGTPELIDNFMVDNLKNIAVNKVGAILGRLDAKDYIDLYLILTKTDFDIFELIELGQQKDGGLEPFVWASLIADVTRLKIFPRMIVKIELEELKVFFLKLRDKILLKIKP